MTNPVRWAWPQTAAMAVSLIAALLLSSCGGGGGVDTGGTGSSPGGFASGPITGFGSVIVGGVRFDDRTAEVEDGNGQRRNSNDLRLGMTVEIDSTPIASDATAVARRILFESELVGPVGAVNVAGNSFNLLGQTVVVNASTVFDDRLASGLAGLRPLDSVEVYADFDPATQRYRATRVEPASAQASARLRGIVAERNATAQTLRIGGAIYSTAGATNVPADLGVGSFVRLQLEFESVRAGWTVRRFGTGLLPVPDRDGARIEGTVTAFASAASFAVNGRAVNATDARVDGSAGLALGARVEVEGSARLGVIRATRVTVRSEDDNSNREFELIGTISAVNAAQRSFEVRGQTVFITRPDLRLDNGTAADLQTGRLVEVRAQLSADRRRLEAVRIRFR